MEWTTCKPTIPGWYWYQDDSGYRFMTVALDRSARGVEILWGTGMSRQGSLSTARLERWPGRWHGPLEPPTEEEGV